MRLFFRLHNTSDHRSGHHPLVDLMVYSVGYCAKDAAKWSEYWKTSGHRYVMCIGCALTNKRNMSQASQRVTSVDCRERSRHVTDPYLCDVFVPESEFSISFQGAKHPATLVRVIAFHMDTGLVEYKAVSSELVQTSNLAFYFQQRQARSAITLVTHPKKSVINELLERAPDGGTILRSTTQGCINVPNPRTPSR